MRHSSTQTKFRQKRIMIQYQCCSQEANMPSPFPGMDPYLEDSSRWADFHPTLIVTLRRHLSRLVSPNFHVDIQEQVYLTEPGEEERRRIAPDVFVTVSSSTQAAPASGTVAITTPVVETPLPESEP